VSYDNAQARLEDGALPFRALGGVGSADRVLDEVADRGDRDFVESLARGLAVIQAFTNQQHQLSIAKISQKTGIARAAVRRYLHTLARLGYVMTRDGHRFSLLPKIVTLGQAYLSACALPELAQGPLDALGAEVGEACSLGLLDEVDMIYVARASSSAVMSPRFNVGGRMPAHCTSVGLVLLAELEPPELEERMKSMRLLAYTERTLTAAALRECLVHVRAEGFAIADQQLVSGIRSIAVPVRDRLGEAVAGINVIVPIQRASIAQMRERYLKPLAQAARTIGSLLP